MTIQAAIDWGKQQLAASEIDSAGLDSELLLAHLLDHERTWLHAHHDEHLPSQHLTTFRHLIAQRQQRVPLVHLTRHREFYGLDFTITPDVLTPRVETEQMVEWAIKHAPADSSLIDIGTGSGAIAIAIAHYRPNLTVTATEISDKALEVARGNATHHGAKITFVSSDLWNSVDGRFDTVVTNLPYLRDDARTELMPEVRHEPAVALFGGLDGLELYRRFLRGLPGHLEPGGFLFTECDPWQHAELITEAAKVGLKPIEQGYFILGFQFQ